MSIKSPGNGGFSIGGLGLLGALGLNLPTPTSAPGEVSFGNTIATLAAAGSGQIVPHKVSGYLVINVGGIPRRVPFF